MKNDYQKLTAQSQLSMFSKHGVSEDAPKYNEVPLFLKQPKRVLDALGEIDWSFTEDDTRFLTHDLHPYPAKFIPQIPGNLISRLSSRGELVYDPFGGSGTTALEAVRLGRRAVSTDANPISAIIGKVKTARISRSTLNELHRLHGYLSAELEDLPNSPQALIEQYSQSAPIIANREKWFPDTSFGELALIRNRILDLATEEASDIALLALSRTVLRVSFQDSETRYKSIPRDIEIGNTLTLYLKEFESVMLAVSNNESATRYGVSKFLTADVRQLGKGQIADESIDLIVTSPPYGNATDYHLYHRFRLLWLGFDPIALGKIEIGSHLKHQREGSGFESYFSDMQKAISSMQRVLRPGRYAALVIGDSVYKGEHYDTAHLLAEKSKSMGFSACRNIERQIHATKRSFSAAGRRAAKEHILILRKKPKTTSVFIKPPPYKLWKYECQLRAGELRLEESSNSDTVKIASTPEGWQRYRKLAFSSELIQGNNVKERTWQAILENGTVTDPSARKDPKYVTHGIHQYKGKFYPQLAKGLINQLDLNEGSRILDPFCGSGTTLLESYLNGFQAIGSDMNPLAVKIARAKTAILDVHPDLVTEVVNNLLSILLSKQRIQRKQLNQFPEETHEELSRWFPNPVLLKLNWLLTEIRNSSAGALQNYLEVILSSIIREVSQQEPTDLRIRYRKEPIKDADVFGLFEKALISQYNRLEKFWAIRGYAPNRFFSATVIEADNRDWRSFQSAGIKKNSIDLVLTSPPYAMALPYIDTDRLSLLAIMGLSSSDRRPIESGLTGSREITTKQKRELEGCFSAESLTPKCKYFVDDLVKRLERDDSAGFRKRNMPSLIWRFLTDMHQVLENAKTALKPGSEAMIVIGDSKMSISGDQLRIPTTDLVEDIAESLGFYKEDRINISVTTENMVHLKNAITENAVLRLKA